jgi:predicted Zn-dependent protease
VARRFAIFILIAILFIACISPHYPVPLNPNNLVKTVYIDKAFNYKEEGFIIDAIKEWECATNYRLKYTVVFKYDNVKSIDPTTSLLIRKVNHNDPLIIESDNYREQHEKQTTKRHTVGLFHSDKNITPEILLVDDRLTNYSYKIVAMHEIGHALGLDHNPSTNTIMYRHSDMSQSYITSEDIKDFCEHYTCEPHERKSCRGDLH